MGITSIWISSIFIFISKCQIYITTFDQVIINSIYNPDFVTEVFFLKNGGTILISFFNIGRLSFEFKLYL